jgi:starch phosphorylase
MTEQIQAPFLPTGIVGVDSLVELALDLRWTWNHRADKIWKELDSDLWEMTHNPWIVLRTVSWDKLKNKLEDPAFRKMIDELVSIRRNEMNAAAWYQEKHAKQPLSCVAYFSMEYMLSEALPIYSGGLGNVAGDQLKAASDLGVPVVGVGLLYQQGYFRQIIDKNGMQQAFFPYNEPGQLPITPLRKQNGEWLRLEVVLPGWSMWFRIWQVTVGRVKLYLLDSNDSANYPVHRGITSELYGGGSELRIRQEMLLGIGGWRVLEAVGLKPEVCHLNEGHAAFAVLARAKSFMNATGQPFDVALAATRVGNLFTTHTAVSAGFDRFSPELVEQYLGNYAKNQLGISLKELLALGRMDPADDFESFNMAYLAIRGSGAVNGVSRLHGKVSRSLFSPLFPRWPEKEVPINYVTNGVHMPSWDSRDSDHLWEGACGQGRWSGECVSIELAIRGVPDINLWAMRNGGRKGLIEFARTRLSRQLSVRGSSEDEVEKAKHLFDPHTLTLGFARRFATYKRPNMLLHDPERLLRILNNPQRPVQLIIAGKAHPADKPGQAMIQQWMHFINNSEARGRVIFISDYDMQVSEQLVRGVDVWINTPRRPWEACGTSGMKVLVNGGLNLSELDGWWAEAYSPDVGWAIGDGLEHGEDPTWDDAEATKLYELLEREVVPEFYNRDAEGIPLKWISRMRESMARLTPKYSATRAVQEYTETYYIPAAKAYLKRTQDKGESAKKIVGWCQDLNEKWPVIRFGALNVTTNNSEYEFEAQVYLDDLSPDSVSVELYAEESEGGLPVIHKMELLRPLKGDNHMYLYRAVILATLPAINYTPRIVPALAGAMVPLEASQIVWQR